MADVHVSGLAQKPCITRTGDNSFLPYVWSRPGSPCRPKGPVCGRDTFEPWHALTSSSSHTTAARTCARASNRSLDPMMSNVIVVDNASPDGVSGDRRRPPRDVVRSRETRGFAYGCNVGWRAGGSAPYVLFLNPDTVIEAESPRSTRRSLEARCGRRRGRAEDRRPRRRAPSISAALPAPSLDLQPRRCSCTACFRGRLGRTRRFGARRPTTQSGIHEWVSGACVLVRRTLLEQLDGLDEGFFLYCEDTDLCRESDRPGYDVRYEPAAVVVHEGGASAPRARSCRVLAASRVRYARKHRSRVAALRAHRDRAGRVHPHAGRPRRVREQSRPRASLRQVASRGAENAWPDG